MRARPDLMNIEDAVDGYAGSKYDMTADKTPTAQAPGEQEQGVEYSCGFCGAHHRGGHVCAGPFAAPAAQQAPADVQGMDPMRAYGLGKETMRSAVADARRERDEARAEVASLRAQQAPAPAAEPPGKARSWLRLLLATAPQERVQACMEDPSLLDAALAEAHSLEDCGRGAGCGVCVRCLDEDRRHWHERADDFASGAEQAHLFRDLLATWRAEGEEYPATLLRLLRERGEAIEELTRLRALKAAPAPQQGTEGLRATLTGIVEGWQHEHDSMSINSEADIYAKASLFGRIATLRSALAAPPSAPPEHEKEKDHDKTEGPTVGEAPALRDQEVGAAQAGDSGEAPAARIHLGGVVEPLTLEGMVKRCVDTALIASDAEEYNGGDVAARDLARALLTPDGLRSLIADCQRRMPVEAGQPLTFYQIEFRNAITRYAERRRGFTAADDGGDHFILKWADGVLGRFPYSLAGLCDACGAVEARLRDDGPAARLALAAEMVAGLPGKDRRLSLGLSAEAHALVASLPGAKSGDAVNPGYACAKVGELEVYAFHRSPEELLQVLEAERAQLHRRGNPRQAGVVLPELVAGLGILSLLGVAAFALHVGALWVAALLGGVSVAALYLSPLVDLAPRPSRRPPLPVQPMQRPGGGRVRRQMPVTVAPLRHRAPGQKGHMIGTTAGLSAALVGGGILLCSLLAGGCDAVEGKRDPAPEERCRTSALNLLADEIASRLVRAEEHRAAHYTSENTDDAVVISLRAAYRKIEREGCGL